MTAMRSTAARQDLSLLSTWERKAQSTTAGVKMDRAARPKQTSSAAQACSTSSAVRTSAKGSPSSCRNGARTARKDVVDDDGG